MGEGAGLQLVTLREVADRLGPKAIHNELRAIVIEGGIPHSVKGTQVLLDADGAARLEARFRAVHARFHRGPYRPRRAASDPAPAA